MREIVKRPWLVFLLLATSCAGTARGCSSCTAQEFGADWVVVQYDLGGRPFRCWSLEGQSIANEQNSDGIYWLSDEGHLVHVSGLYNRVQVEGGRWDQAFAEVGLTRESCRALQARRFDPETGAYAGDSR